MCIVCGPAEVSIKQRIACDCETYRVRIHRRMSSSSIHVANPALDDLQAREIWTVFGHRIRALVGSRVQDYGGKEFQA